MFKKFVLKSLCVLSLFAIFTNCQIGLGESVDTDAPSGEITSPGVNAVIRDAFAIKGDWKDDGSVTQVKVNLRNTITRESADYNSVVNRNGSWICAIDPEDESQPLYDGKYLATITLIDDVGHSTVLTRSYTIDNTPPVVILSHLEDVKDVGKAGVEVKTYGRVFSLNGKAADDNNIANLEVRFYGDAACNNELLDQPVTKHNIALTIEQNVASFNTPVYDAIYGNNENGGTKQLYCRVWAYDEAQRYPVDGSAQTEEDKLGNCQKNYYLQKTLETTKANGKGLDEYSTNDLYAMFNNTYTTSSQSRAPMTASEISAVLKELNGIGIDVGTFKINPKNNPYFTVIGLNNVLYKYKGQSDTMLDEAKKEAKTGFQVTNGDSESGVYLQININPGLDGYSILNDSVKYYLQECDEEGNVYLEKDAKTEKMVPVNSIPLGEGGSSLKTKPLSTVNYVNIPTGKFETGRYYRVVVEGTDTKENSIDSDYTDDGKEKVYAFYLAAHTGGIEIYSLEAKPEGKATDYVSSNTTNSTDASKDYRKLNVKLTYSYNGNSDLYVWRKFDNNSYGDEPHAKGLKKGSDAVWSEKITAEELKGHKTVTYLLKSEDGVNFSRDRAITLKIDDTNPVILNDDETPITKPEAKDTSNTSFQFTGQAKDTDSGVAEVWVRLENTEKDADGKLRTYEEKLNTTEYWTFTVIKDGKITDEKNPSYGGVLATEGEKKAVFWAIDKVGLKSDEVTVDWTYKDTKPELKLTGYKVDGEKDEGKQIDLMSSEGEFAVGKKFTLNGITKDEYGVEKITIVQTNAETGVAEEPIVITAKDKNNWTAQGKEGIVWTLPELPIGGVIKNQTIKYKYQFTVTDKAGLNYGSKVLTVTVDDSVTKPCEIDTPVLKSFGEKALSGPLYQFGGTYDTAKASVIGIKTIKYAITKLGEAPVFNNETVPEGGSWSFVKSLDPGKADSLAEGKYTLYVKAIDGANKESEVTSRDFCVDLSKPEVKIEVFKDSAEEALETDNGTYKINNDGSVKSFKLKITASDANGIAGVTVKNGEDSVRLTKDGDVWTSADFEVEGTYNFAVEVEDGSGNGLSGDEAVPGKKVNETVSVIFDKTAPEISATNADEKADSLATWFTGTSSTYITGTSSDAGSGIKARTISIDGGEEQNVTNSDDWNYKLTLEGLAENDESAESFHTLTVKAVDAVGNSSEKTYYFRYDVGVPTLTVKSDKENINAEDKLTISGQVYDGASVDANRAVKALEITATKDGAAYTFKKDALTENKNLCGDYSYVIDGAKMDEGSYIFTIKATDFAKNDVTKTVSLVVDKTAPKISQIEADVTISSTADNSKKDGETKWYKTQTHSITVSAADTTAGSGIENVEWCTLAADSEVTDETEWQPLTKKGEGLYKGTVTFTSEGLGNKLYVRVTDKAGNSSKFATKAGDYVVFNIDTTKPALALSKVQIGSNDSKITNGTEYINNTASITLYGTYSNTISGVEALSFGKKDSAPALTEAFEYFAGEIPEGKAIETLSYLPYSSIKDKAKITYWKAKFENKDLTTGDLYVNGSSVAGLSTDDTKLFKLNKDTIAPNVRNIKLSTSSNKYKVYQPEQKELVFFVNNKNTSEAPQTFTIFGIAEDGNTDSKGDVTDSAVSGVAKVELAIEGLAKQSSTSASFSEVDLSKINGESTTATLTVTDNAGNSSEEKITIKVDNAGPKGVHALDSSENGGKDLYFRVGEQNRDDGVEKDLFGEVILDNQNNAKAAEGAPAWNAEKDRDVGGKYSGNTFSNAEKIKLRGRYDDSESGVNLVYYKVYSVQPDSNKTKDFLNNYERDASGYFSLSDKEETKRVFYTGAVTAFEGGEEVTFKPENGGTTSEGKYYTDVTTNYKATLANLNTGRNYIVLVAVDNVGNASLESVKHNGVVYDNYLINVDTQAPEITSNAKLVTNATKDLTISGTVEDNPSELKAGIKDVWVKYFDSQKAEKKLKAEIDDSGKWTVSIAKKDLESLYGTSKQSKTVNFTAIATDNAGTGNTSSCNTTVVIDKTAPEVKINVASLNDADPAEGIQINGTISISGTASDENKLSATENMVLEYQESGAESWAPLADITSAESWTFSNIDTRTKLSDNTTYNFRVSATDSVGNSGYSEAVKATVNQDSDRPVIKFTNLKLENMAESARLVMTSNELYGSVTDDDGVEKLEYAYAESEDKLKNISWQTLALTNSSFTLKLEDGSKNLYFKVTDNGGTSFVTSSADEYSLKSPKLVDSEKEANQYGYKNADSGKRSTVTYITVDTLPPEYGTMQFTKVSAKPEWKNESEIDSTPVGGTQNKLNIRIPAYDVNGIASVVMKIPGVKEEIKFTESTDSKDKTTVGTHTDVKYWLSGLITIPSDTASGTKACSITITDGSGKTSKDEFSILIDNKAPVVTADALEDKDYDVAGTQINGTIEITGTASDENKLSATENMVLEYKKAGTESWTKFADITSAESWTFANVDTTELPDNTTYNFRISATDSVGNVGYSKSITAKVDQDTDRPVIKLTSVDLNKDGIKLESSGFRGTVSDDDGIPESLSYKLGANGKWIDSKDNGSNLQYTEDGAFYLTLDDGNYDVYFKVGDYTSNTFAASYTPSASDLNGMVKLTDKNGNQAGYRSSEVKNTALTMTVDTTEPYLGDFEYSTDYDAANAKKAHWAKKDTISSVTLGGNTKKITVRVPAWDINKIDAENSYVEIPGVGNKKLTDSKENAKVTDYPEATWWISETAEITDTGTKNCTVSVKDTFNKESTDSFKIKVDNEGPEITLNALKDADSSVSETQINGTISITGKADDESGLSTTENMVLEYQKSGTEDWTPLADITSAESWTFKDVDTTTSKFVDTETYSFRVSATDRLGNTGYSNTVTATVDQDTDRPVIKFTNLDLRTLNASSRTLLGTTVFSGIVTDDDGVPASSTVAYKLNKDDKWHYATDSDSKLTYSDSDGSFILELDDGGYDVYFKVGDYTSNTFAENYIPTASDLNGMVKVTDKSGTKFGYKNSTVKNTALLMTIDTTDPFIGDYEYSTDYDEAKPEKATWTKKPVASTPVLGGTKNKLRIRVPAWDANGIDETKAVIKENNTEFALKDSKTNASLEAYPKATYWISEEIDLSGNSTLTKNYTISVEDKNERPNSSKFSVLVDNTKPVITIDNLANKINKKINITGKARDTDSELSATEKMILEYQKSGAEGWTTLAVITSAESWTFKDVDTRTSKFVDTETYNFRVSATDSLGNTGYSDTVTATVDQDSDRPVIKFTNISLEGMAENSRRVMTSKELYGSVTDDDGVQALYYQFADDSSWHELVLENGSFKLALKEDGSKAVNFKVVDKAGTEFITSNLDKYSLETPKLVDSEDTPNQYGYVGAETGKMQTVTYITVDTKAPDLGTLQFSRNYNDAEPAWSDKSSINITPFGGTKNKLKIRIPAWDVNGISSVTMNIPGVGNVSFTEEANVSATVTDSDKVEHTDAKYWISDEVVIPNKSIEDGSKSCTVTVLDISSKESKDTFSLLVDNTAPVVKTDSLKDADSENAGIQINGLFAISGKASDDNGLGSEEIELYYRETTKDSTSNKAKVTSVEGWEKLDQTNSESPWSFTGVDTNTKLEDNKWYDFTIAATDKTGNTGYSDVIKVNVDQDTDRPVIKLTTVDLNSERKLTTSDISGTVSDDDGIPSKLAYRIGSTGDFIDSEADGSKLKYSAADGTFTLTLDEGESAVYFKADGYESNTFAASYIPTASDLNSMVKLTDTKGTKFGYKDTTEKNTVLSVTVDLTAPIYNEFKYFVSEKNGDNAGKFVEKTKDEITSATKPLLGGNTNKLKLSVPAWDKNGIASVTLDIQDKDSITLTKTDKKKTVDKNDFYFYEAEVDVSTFESGINKYTVVITDNFERVTTSSLNITVDNTAPVVTLNALKDADSNKAETQINGTIEVSGKANDEFGFSADNFVLYAREKVASDAEITSVESIKGWTKLKDVAAASAWTFSEVDTLAHKLKDYASYYFTVEAKDSLGNVGYSAPVTATVDQDTDRPVITIKSPADISSLSSGNILYENSKISGTVEDDDEVTYFGYNTDGSATYTELTLNSGRWTIENLKDGISTVYFKVTAGGKDYTVNNSYLYNDDVKLETYKLTDEAETPNRFGYYNASNSKVTTANALVLKVDTTEPSYGDFEYSSTAESSWTAKTEITKTQFGANNKFKIQIPVWDANGIKSVALNIPDFGNVELNESTRTATVKDSNNEEHTDAKFWESEEITIPKTTSDGLKSCSITITDKANKTSRSNFSIVVDNTAPVVLADALKDADTSASGTQINGTIAVSGKITEDNGFSSEKMKIFYREKTAADTKTPESVSSTEGWTMLDEAETTSPWSFAAVDTTKLKDNTTYFFTVEATDKAGNTGYSAPVAAIVDQDTDRPVIKITSMKLDSDGRQLGYNNSEFSGTVSDDDGIPSAMAYRLGSSGDFIDSKAENSVLKYSETDGSFSITLPDESYEVYFNIGEYESSVTPSADKKAVKLTDNSGTKYGYKNSSVESTVLPVRIDTTDPVYGNLEYSRNYDATNPEWNESISSTRFGGTQNKLKVRIPAWDANGIGSVVMNIPDVGNVTFTEDTATATVKDSANKEHTGKYWISGEITIADTVESGTKVSSVTVTDKANKTAKQDVSVIVDNTAPEVKFNVASLNDADSAEGIQINGKISVSGTASNEKDAEKMILEYQKAGKTEWTTLAETTSESSWIFAAVDTTKLSDNTTYNFRVKATDTVGNTGHSAVVKATVNQDTDRPVIKISNISLEGMTSSNALPVETNTLYGNVSDDDGVAGLSYKIPSMSDYKEITLTNGSFTLANIPDGSQTISFKVKDNNGSEFESTAEYNLKAPKLLDSDSTANKFGYKGGNGNTFAYLKVDTKAPYLGELKFSTNYVAATETTAATGTWSAKTDLSTAKFGGTTNKLRIKVPAWDANYIKENGTKDEEIYNFIKIPAKDGDVIVKLTYTTETPADDEKDAVYKDATYYLSDEIDISKLSSGSKSCSISVMDNSGKDKTSSASFTFEVDNTVPAVSMDSLNDADSEAANGTQLNGTISITGKASDDSGLSTENIKLYFREKTASDTTDPKSVTSLDGWTAVTADFKVDEENLDKWTFSNVNTAALEKTYASGEEHKTTVYFTVEAKDSLGNTGYSAPVAAEINQDTDRPVIKFNDISLKEMSASNYFQFETDKLKGSVSDDDGVPAKLAYRFGATGDFIDSEAAGSKLKYSATNGSFTLAFEDGSKDLYFKVTDRGNVTKDSKVVAGTFESSTSYSVTSPKLIDSEETPNELGDGSTVTYIMIDTTAPSTRDTKFTKTPAAAESWNSEISKASFGGTQNKFYMQQQAYDVNGVKKVYLSVPVAEKDGKSDAITAWTYKDSSNNKTTVYTKDSWPTTEKCYESYDMTGDGIAITAVSSDYNEITVGGNSYTREAYIFPLVKGDEVSDGYYLWQSAYDAEDEKKCKPVDVTNLASGTRIASLITFDGIKSSTATVTLSIDWDPVKFEFSSHKQDQTVYGIKEVEVRGNVKANDASKVYYCVTNAKTTPVNSSADGWTEIKEGTTSATIKFDGKLVSEESTKKETHDKKLRDLLADLYNVSDIDKSDKSETLKIWVYVEDLVGNKSKPTALSLNVIPNGDKPVVTISYPKAGDKLGGTIRFSGETTIETSSVSKVYAQIYVPKATEKDWEEKLNEWVKKHYTGTDTIYKVVDIDDKTRGIEVSGTPSGWNFTLNSRHELEQDDTPNFTLKFIAISDTGKLSDVAERTIQIDKNAPSITDIQLVKFVKLSDAKNPDFDLFASSNITTSIPYEEGMWISGEWYLIGSVSDDNGVKELTWHDGTKSHTLVEPNKTTNSGSINDTEVKEDVIVLEGDEHKTEVKENGTTTTITAHDYSFCLPIGKSEGYGAIKFEIAATDATSQDNKAERSITVNYDNQAPDFKATVSLADNAEELAANGNSVKDSQGMYTLYGTFEEAGNQSGFSRIAMYFTRTIDEKVSILDPMVTKNKASGTNDKKNNYYDAKDFACTTVEEGGDGIYWKTLEKATIAADSKGSINSETSDTITVSGVPAWVRKGGLCKVDGVIYKIVSATKSSIKIDGTLIATVENETKNIYVTPALVIDHLSAEAKKQGQTYDGLYYDKADISVITGGDGDWLIEAVTQTTTSYQWTASIKSQNIKDGPVTIHFVAFDKAGNASEKSYEADVANNAPRIAGVTVWTDYNGNGSGWRTAHKDYDDETKSRYYSRVRPTINGKATYRSNDVTTKLIVSGDDNDVEGIAAANSTAFMKVTDTVKFIPEIVGGNDGLFYEYKIGKKSAFTVDSDKNVSKFTVSTEAGKKALQSASESPILDDSNKAVSGNDNGETIPTVTDADSVTYITGNTDGVITFDGEEILGNLDTSTSTAPTWFDIVISDSTEGARKLSCEMQIALQVNYKDETAPWAKIKPFYWNSRTKNSVKWNKDTPLGHIELEDDLSEAIRTTTLNNRPMGKDPKVSGQIVLEGTAYDDIRLSKLYAQFTDHAGLSTYTLIGEYDNSKGEWSSKKGTGWEASVENLAYDSTGHKAKWTVTLDTAQVAAKKAIVGLDRTFTVFAVDARGTATDTTTISGTTLTGNTSVSTIGTTQTAKAKADAAEDSSWTAFYMMDVVPYITDVTTELVGKLKTSIKKAYGRTALGHYIARNDEDITINGFNLAGAKYGNTTVGSTAGVVTLPASSITTSGAIALTVNGIETINNKNNNEAKGSYDGTMSKDASYDDKKAYAYNRMPNNQGNNNLTDDVSIDVWQFDSDAALPVSGELREPVMKINPVTGIVGFAFVAGPADYSMADGTGNSYKIYQHNYATFSNVAMDYDEYGNSFGIVTGLDTYPDSNTKNNTLAGRLTFQTSHWGASAITNMDDNYMKDNKQRLEAIGLPNKDYCTVKGVGQDSYTMTETRFYSPSLVSVTHGENNTAVYLAYYDSVQDQIRFRFNSKVSTERGDNFFSADNDDFVDNIGISNDLDKDHKTGIWVNQNGWKEYTGGNDSSKHVFESYTDYFSLIAGKDWQKVNDNKFYDTGYTAGKYVAIDAIKGSAANNDVVVAVWFDGTNCRYAYNTNPTSKNDNGAEGGWTGNKVIFSEGGEHCTVKVDANGGIHIAANVDGTLKYAYLSKYNATYKESENSVVVDSYTTTGEKINLDVGLKTVTVNKTTSNVAVPYISYYMGTSKRPAVASLVVPENGTVDYTAAGTDKDSLFTGNWEVSLVPTPSTLNDWTVDKINIGLWKTKSGVITGCKDDTFTFKAYTSSNNESTNKAGNCFGNGTANPIMGYSIKSNAGTCIETAQMK